MGPFKGNANNKTKIPSKLSKTCKKKKNNTHKIRSAKNCKRYGGS